MTLPYMKRLAAIMIIFPALAFAIGTIMHGVSPVNEWDCPKTHPIKGNINTAKGTMIYHLPCGYFYHKTKPERCYATEEDAKADGFRKSKK